MEKPKLALQASVVLANFYAALFVFFLRPLRNSQGSECLTEVGADADGDGRRETKWAGRWWFVALRVREDWIAGWLFAVALVPL